MRVPFARADFVALNECWGRFYPDRYAVTPELIESHTIGSKVFDWGASSIEAENSTVRGFVAIKRSAGPALYKGPDPDQAHISALAFDDPTLGIDLISRAKKILAARGVQTLIFGQDNRHFFPGCPVDFPALRDFLMVEGFDERSETHDLERDLSHYEPPQRAQPIGPTGIQARACTVSDRKCLAEFLNREFPGRWEHDVLQKFDLEGPATIFGLFSEDRCEGFALLQSGNVRLPIGGAVWHGSLGPLWGALGPIGISKDLRGQGMGHSLLASALLELKRRSVQQCIIDWTSLVGFYGEHGFEVSRSYKTLKLELMD